MSVILKISRFGAADRVLELRGVFLEVGEDSAGLLSVEKPAHPLFSLFEVEGRYRVSVREGCSYTLAADPEQSSPLLANESLWVAPGDNLCFGDTRFALFPISAESEALAYGAPRPLEALTGLRTAGPLPILRCSVHPSRREISLFPGVTYSVGRDAKNAVVLDIPGVAARHLDIASTELGVAIIPRLGCVTIEGREIESPITLTQNGAVALSPTGIVLSLERVSK